MNYNWGKRNQIGIGIGDGEEQFCIEKVSCLRLLPNRPKINNEYKLTSVSALRGVLHLKEGRGVSRHSGGGLREVAKRQERRLVAIEERRREGTKRGGRGTRWGDGGGYGPDAAGEHCCGGAGRRGRLVTWRVTGCHVCMLASGRQGRYRKGTSSAPIMGLHHPAMQDHATRDILRR